MTLAHDIAYWLPRKQDISATTYDFLKENGHKYSMQEIIAYKNNRVIKEFIDQYLQERKQELIKLWIEKE